MFTVESKIEPSKHILESDGLIKLDVFEISQTEVLEIAT